MGKSYNNTLRSHEVSIAVEKFFIGAYPQTFTATRVDVSAMPAGYFDCGAIVEDSPSVQYNREVFRIETGIPRAVQFEQVVAVSGSVSFAIYSNTAYTMQYALGNASTITTVTTVASGSVTTQYFGTGIIKEYSILGVADFCNGAQIIHEIPRVTCSGNIAEAFRPGQVGTIPLTFNAKSVSATVNGCEHLIVMKRHYISGDGVACTMT